MTLLFVWIDLNVLQLKLMHNALFSDKTRDDFKEMKREIQTISEKLKSQMTSTEEGINFICLIKHMFSCLMKEEIADIKEKLDTLMNRLPLEEKKQKMEGKIYFFSGSGADN